MAYANYGPKFRRRALILAASTFATACSAPEGAHLEPKADIETRVFMLPNTRFTVLDPDVAIFGAPGFETVRFFAGASARMNANVERVDFAAPTADHTFQIIGNQALVRQGGIVIASVLVQDDGDGTRLRFTDGGADLRIAGLNQSSLGGVALSNAEGGAAITPHQMGANFNAADASGSTSPPPSPPSPGPAPLSWDFGAWDQNHWQ